MLGCGLPTGADDPTEVLLVKSSPGQAEAKNQGGGNGETPLPWGSGCTGPGFKDPERSRAVPAVE